MLITDVDERQVTIPNVSNLLYICRLVHSAGLH